MAAQIHRESATPNAQSLSEKIWPSSTVVARRRASEDEAMKVRGGKRTRGPEENWSNRRVSTASSRTASDVLKSDDMSANSLAELSSHNDGQSTALPTSQSIETGPENTSSSSSSKDETYCEVDRRSASPTVTDEELLKLAAPLSKEQLIQILCSAAAVSPYVRKLICDESIASPASRRIMVRNIHYSTTDARFAQHFSTFGALEDAAVVRERSGRSKGFGFVTFAEYSAMQKCLDSPLHLDGRKLFVKVAADPFSEFLVDGVPVQGRCTRRKIFVRNLGPCWNSQVLEQYFGRYGCIEECAVVFGSSGVSKGFGFVTFQKQDSAVRAAAEPQQTVLGRVVFVSMAKSTGSTAINIATNGVLLGPPPGVSSGGVSHPNGTTPQMLRTGIVGESATSLSHNADMPLQDFRSTTASGLPLNLLRQFDYCSASHHIPGGPNPHVEVTPGEQSRDHWLSVTNDLVTDPLSIPDAFSRIINCPYEGFQADGSDSPKRLTTTGTGSSSGGGHGTIASSLSMNKDDDCSSSRSRTMFPLSNSDDAAGVWSDSFDRVIESAAVRLNPPSSSIPPISEHNKARGAGSRTRPREQQLVHKENGNPLNSLMPQQPMPSFDQQVSYEPLATDSSASIMMGCDDQDLTATLTYALASWHPDLRVSQSNDVSPALIDWELSQRYTDYACGLKDAVF